MTATHWLPFGECEQRKGARLSIDFGLSLATRQTASNVLRTTKPEIQKQQRIRRERPDIDRFAELYPKRRMAYGKELNRRHLTAPEGAIFDLNRMQQDAEVNVATLKHSKDIWADCLDHSHVHFGITLGIAVQESREDHLNLHRRSGHVERAGVSALQRFCTLADCFSMGQQRTTLREQLLTF